MAMFVDEYLMLTRAELEDLLRATVDAAFEHYRTLAMGRRPRIDTLTREGLARRAAVHEALDTLWLQALPGWRPTPGGEDMTHAEFLTLLRLCAASIGGMWGKSRGACGPTSGARPSAR